MSATALDETPPVVTVEEFRTALHKFREWMGERSFWEDQNRPMNTMKALMLVYARTRDTTPTDGLAMESAVNEFNRRSVHVFMHMIWPASQKGGGR